MVPPKSLLLLSSRLQNIVQFESQKLPETHSFIYSHSLDVKNITARLRRKFQNQKVHKAHVVNRIYCNCIYWSSHKTLAVFCYFLNIIFSLVFHNWTYNDMQGTV